MITVSYAEEQLHPDLVLGYEWAREIRNIVHPVLSRPRPAVTLRPAAPRSGTLRYFFLTEAGALVCEDAHALAEAFHVLDDERPALEMDYVATGTLRVQLDPDTRTRWIVSVDFQEIS